MCIIAGATHVGSYFSFALEEWAAMEREVTDSRILVLSFPTEDSFAMSTLLFVTAERKCFWHLMEEPRMLLNAL